MKRETARKINSSFPFKFAYSQNRSMWSMCKQQYNSSEPCILNYSISVATYKACALAFRLKKKKKDSLFFLLHTFSSCVRACHCFLVRLLSCLFCQSFFLTTHFFKRLRRNKLNSSLYSPENKKLQREYWVRLWHWICYCIYSSVMANSVIFEDDSVILFSFRKRVEVRGSVLT